MSESIKSSLSQLAWSVSRDEPPASKVFEATTVSDSDSFATSSAVREFTIRHDEPAELGGDNTAPTPLEAALAALGSGQAVAYRAHASLLGLRIDRIEVRARGYLDVRGFLNVAPVPVGFKKVTISTRIASPEPRERIRELAHIVAERCPVLATLQSPATLTVEIDSANQGAAESVSGAGDGPGSVRGKRGRPP